MAVVLLAFVAFVSLGLPDGVLGVAWPSVAATFGIPLSQLGVLLAASTTGYLVSSFSSGAVVRRLGVGKVLMISSVMMACATGGYAASPRWPVMVVIGVLAGLGSGAIDAALNGFAARHFSPRVMNWMHAFYGVGATLGPLLMTTVLATGLVWRWGYALICSGLAAMSLCFLLTLRLWDTPPRAAADDQHDDEPAGTLQTLRRPVVLLNIALFFLYTGVEVTAGQWAYTLFTLSRGTDPVVAGVWVGVYWASLTVGRILFGTVAAHVAPLVLIRLAMLAAPLAALLIWANLSPLVSFLGLALMGFCFAPMFPLLMSLTPARVGRAAEHQAIGFQVGAACLGAAGLPGLTGLVVRWTGQLETIGPVLLVSTILLLVVHEIIAGLPRTL